MLVEPESLMLDFCVFERLVAPQTFLARISKLQRIRNQEILCSQVLF